MAQTLGLLATAALPGTPALAHTPYAQWDVFRKGHLQILTSHADLNGDDLGEIGRKLGGRACIRTVEAVEV